MESGQLARYRGIPRSLGVVLGGSAREGLLKVFWLSGVATGAIMEHPVSSLELLETGAFEALVGKERKEGRGPFRILRSDGTVFAQGYRTLRGANNAKTRAQKKHGIDLKVA